MNLETLNLSSLAEYDRARAKQVVGKQITQKVLCHVPALGRVCSRIPPYATWRRISALLVLPTYRPFIPFAGILVAGPVESFPHAMLATDEPISTRTRILRIGRILRKGDDCQDACVDNRAIRRRGEYVI